MKTAVFPGSFDPFTLAHEDLVKRALPFFDQIIVAVGVNRAKRGLIPVMQRVEVIERVASRIGEGKVLVTHYEDLTVNFCQAHHASVILRGLRNTSDFEFEKAIAQNNKQLNPQIETFFLMTSPEYGHLSSTIVRDVLSHQGDISGMVSSEILDVLHK